MTNYTVDEHKNGDHHTVYFRNGQYVVSEYATQRSENEMTLPPITTQHLQELEPTMSKDRIAAWYHEILNNTNSAKIAREQLEVAGLLKRAPPD
jgi:hypothetical protein